MNSVLTLFLDSLRQFGAQVIERVPYLAAAAIVFVLFLGISRVAVRGAVAAGERAHLDPSLPALIGRIGSFGLTVVGLLIAATIVVPSFRPGDLMAGLGISSIAIGFAAKDILQNFFAGILLLWKKPFRVGDDVRIAEFEGVVQDIDTRATILRTYNGERAVLPNGIVYGSSILVKNANLARRLVQRFQLVYGTDLDRAREITLGALSSSEGVLEDPAPSVFVSELGRASIEIKVYLWISTSGGSPDITTDSALANVKRALQGAGIEFADKNSMTLVSETADPRP